MIKICLGYIDGKVVLGSEELNYILNICSWNNP
jgi:hypothetical protein